MANGDRVPVILYLTLEELLDIGYNFSADINLYWARVRESCRRAHRAMERMENDQDSSRIKVDNEG